MPASMALPSRLARGLRARRATSAPSTAAPSADAIAMGSHGPPPEPDVADMAGEGAAAMSRAIGFGYPAGASKPPSTENGTSTYDPGSVSVSVPRYSAKPPRRTVTGTAASRSLFPCASTGTAHNRCGILGTSHQVAGFVCRRSSQKRTVTLTVSPGCGRVVESCTPNGGVFAHAGPAAARASTVPTTRTLSATTDRRIKASLRRTLLLHRPARDGSPRRTLRLRVRDREAGDLADQDALARCVHRDDHVLERRDQCLAVTRHGAPDVVRRRVDDLPELHQQPTAVAPCGLDGERSAVLQVDQGPFGESPVDLRQHQDGELALQAVGPGDAADHDGRLAVHPWSTISTAAWTPSRMAAAFTTWRMARAVRPPLPMTLPMSSGSTVSWRRIPRSSWTSFTSTASGFSTSSLAMYSRSSFTTPPCSPSSPTGTSPRYRPWLAALGRLGWAARPFGATPAPSLRRCRSAKDPRAGGTSRCFR